MTILKLSRIKLIPIFVVAFCIAITSCTQKEILLEVIEQSTEILDLKTTDAIDELAMRMQLCIGLEAAVNGILNTLIFHIESFSKNPTPYRAYLVYFYFKDYIDLLNSCVPGINIA